MTDVAIVGVGIYPFGRHKDVAALEMGAAAARAALADAGMRWPDIPYAVGGSFEVDIPDAMVAYLGLQDTDAGAEIIHMAEVGLCADGEQERMLAEGETSIGGRLPVNTDGGLIANGEPIGASGLRQIHELTLQLQGRAGGRQVPQGPRTGLAHLYGAPGISSVTIVST